MLLAIRFVTLLLLINWSISVNLGVVDGISVGSSLLAACILVHPVIINKHIIM
jgi:hypothetical protein